MMSSPTTERIRTTLDRLRIQTDTRRIDATPATTHVRRLYTAGMGSGSIARAADLDPHLISRMATGARPPVTVTQSEADAILDVDFIPDRIDAAPLWEWARRHQTDRITPSDTRWLYRARADGACNPWHAEQILHRYWGVTLNTVYGPDWERHAAPDWREAA